MVKKQILSVILLWIFLPVAFGANYFVDFVNGSDTNPGTQISPFQHSPGSSAATGVPAGITLQAGDTVNFKGGVANTNAISGAITVSANGTPANPIIFEGSPSGFGSGRAIFEGTDTLGNTNGTCFIIQGGAGCVIQNFDIRDYSGQIMLLSSPWITISNNLIHHSGFFPYNSAAGNGGHGYGIKLLTGANGLTVVSNAIYDINASSVYDILGASSNIYWGNIMTNVQDHNYFQPNLGLWGYNSVHDFNDPNSHDDILQSQGFGTLLVVGNKSYNANSQLFANPKLNTVNGTIYAWDNVFLKPGSSDGTGAPFNCILYDTSQATSSSAGFVFFNNTVLYQNDGNYGMHVDNRSAIGNTLGQFVNLNNIFYQSGNANATASGLVSGNTTPGWITTINQGYNTYTNSVRGNSVGPGSSEINSEYAVVTFANLTSSAQSPNADLHLALGSAGSGTGTNLSTLVPASAYNWLPARYAVSPSVAADGVARGSTWDRGAFQGASTLPQNRIMRVTNLRVGTVNGSLTNDILHFGAVGDGTTLNTAAIQAAVAATSRGGTVLAHDGIYKTGTIFLSNNITFFIAPTATILGGTNQNGGHSDYPTLENNVTSNVKQQGGLIVAANVTNVTVCGGGYVNGNGTNGFPPSYPYSRPNPILSYLSSNIVVRDITIADSGGWSCVHNQTMSLTISNVTINNHQAFLGGPSLFPNRDGIDIVDCQNVTVVSNSVATEDDCLTVKSGASFGVKNVTFQGNKLVESDANAIKVGLESWGVFTNILFKDTTITNVESGSGVIMASVDGGAINGVTFQNVAFGDVANAMLLYLGIQDNGVPVGSITNVTFRDFFGQTEQNTSGRYGSPLLGTITNTVTYYPGGILLTNLNILYWGTVTPQPADPPEYYGGDPHYSMFGGPYPAYGYYMRHLNGVTIVNCTTTVAGSPSDARPAYDHVDVLNYSGP